MLQVNGMIYTEKWETMNLYHKKRNKKNISKKIQINQNNLPNKIKKIQILILMMKIFTMNIKENNQKNMENQNKIQISKNKINLVELDKYQNKTTLEK